MDWGWSGVGQFPFGEGGRLVGVVLALSAAVAYGVADFCGGLLSRRVAALAVAFAGQLAATVVAVVAAGTVSVLVPGEAVTGAALGWGAVCGVGTGFGGALLYRGLGKGRMSQVSPVSAATSAVLPVLTALVLGERPSLLALAGVVVGIPAVFLVARGSAPSMRDAPGGAGQGPAAGTVDGLLAGAGFALAFLALSRIPAGTGLWPVAVAEAVSVLIVVVLAKFTGTRLRVSARDGALASVIGLVAVAALGLYLVSTRGQLLTIVVVLASLYPAVTVLLAASVLQERVRRLQLAGLAAAGLAVGLLALG